ncbi:hypothetical protein [Sphingobium sp. CAP-1]|uniref:hypothetical protein n=1 Tax=Sphingobium sp. CAP-1 TaxID=2676077 RepID=UPI0012BB404F|nr:hypothetical protein [Sphingobium sp. CAP-1]QGP79985.1 hypothetical protein GL174_14085 [Sphingobium sp. CAP-1]
MPKHEAIKVPDTDHLMRYVPYKQQVRDAETNAFKGIANTAFQIRPSDKGGLSTTWVEHYGAKGPATYGAAASAFRDSLPSKKLGATAYFAVGNVGATREKCLDKGKSIRLVVVPDGTNTGHVEIHKFSDEDRELLDILAIDVFGEHVAVSNLPLS